MTSFRKTVVVIPTLNEAATLGCVLEALLADHGKFDIWIFDGGSTDGTQEIANGYAAKPARIRVFHNPNVTQAHAVNMAARIAADHEFEYLIRVDAHAVYPEKYVSKLVAKLDEGTPSSVVVPLISASPSQPSAWGKACADLQRSWLGNGGAQHRRPSIGGWVEHGHHAAFRLSTFLELNGYDTSFSACEDVDYDMRLTQAGHRIWMAADLPVQYIPRASPSDLLQQMMRNGYARANCARKHHRTLSLRQLLPLVAVAASLLSLIAAPLIAPSFAYIALAYIALIFILACLANPALGLGHSLRIGWLALVAHTGFALGLTRSWTSKFTTGSRSQ